MALNIRELARLCGVSTATVSLVLSGKDLGRVGAERRRHILRIAEKHGYRSNPAAKALAEGRTYRVALVIEGALSDHAVLGQFSFYERLGALSAGLRDHCYAIEIVQLNPRRSDAEAAAELDRAAVDGFLFVHWRPETVAPLLRGLRERRRPAVASGTALPGNDYTWTDVDRGAAFADAVRRLVEEGHRRVALIDCAVSHAYPYSAEKRRAFLAAVRDHLGVEADGWVFPSDAARGRCRSDDITYERVAAWTAEARRRLRGGRAFLLTDNFYAGAVLHALRAAGLRPGPACRVIGFGDTALADRCRPRLSHYTLRVDAQARFSVEALIEQTAFPAEYRPRQRLFAPRYLRRDT